jgi:outer membrane PBP1 activator LpoA protein
MIVCLRPLSALCLACLVVACSSSPPSTLGELPRTPLASIEQMLEKAGNSTEEESQQLRLSAAQLAYAQGNPSRAAAILAQVDMPRLKPAQQIYASTLRADLALAHQDAKAALAALDHPRLPRCLTASRPSKTRTASGNCSPVCPACRRKAVRMPT